MATGNGQVTVMFAVLGGGALLIYSGLAGVSLSDAIVGKGPSLNASGGAISSNTDSNALTQAVQAAGNATATAVGSGGSWTAPAGGAHSFKGPAANLLNQLAGQAQNQYHLTITATTNGTHVPGSYHYQGRAFDASGTEANMKAFASYCESIKSQLKELIHNPGFAVKNGQDVNGPVFYAAVWAGHKDHVHVAA